MSQTDSKPTRRQIITKWGIRGLAAAAWLGTLAVLGGYFGHKDLIASARALPTQRAVTPAAKDPAVIRHDLPALLTKTDLAGLSEGHGPVHLTIFVDPNCIYCHLLWEKLQSPALKGRFTITYVPVAFLKKSSLGKAETILALGHKPMMKNPLVRNDFSGGLSAMATDEANFDLVHESGAIKPIDLPSIAWIIQRNTKEWGGLMKSLGRPAATPTVIVGQNRILVGDPTPAVLMAWAQGR